MPKKAPAPERSQQFTGEEGKELHQCNWSGRKNNSIEMAVFLYTNKLFATKNNAVRKLYCTSDMTASPSLLGEMPQSFPTSLAGRMPPGTEH